MSGSDIRFTEEHEWVKLDGDIVVIGISEYATEELGEVVFVELSEKGKEIEKTAEFGSVESVKTVSGLFSPLDGEIVDVNQAVVDNPELINQSPQDEGWLVKLRPHDKEEWYELMDHDAYKNYLESL